jgi:hypothetical protein
MALEAAEHGFEDRSWHDTSHRNNGPCEIALSRATASRAFCRPCPGSFRASLTRYASEMAVILFSPL